MEAQHFVAGKSTLAKAGAMILDGALLGAAHDRDLTFPVI
jgi:hypothetical protein